MPTLKKVLPQAISKIPHAYTGMSDANTQGLKIEYVEMKSIKPWKENPKDPKLIMENAEKVVKPLILKYGFRSPLIVYKKNRTIYKGNTTFKAAELIGMSHIPVLFVDFQDEATAIQYGLSDNNAGAHSEWDTQLLKRLISGEELRAFVADQKSFRVATGFTEKQLTLIMHHTGDALPDALPDIDLQGATPGKTDFMFLQFDSKEQLETFRKRIGLRDPRGKVVPYQLLQDLIEGKLPPAVTTVAPHLRKMPVLKKKA